MKKLSLLMTAIAVMGLMTMISCRKPNVGNISGEAKTITFNATTESNGGSKTYLDDLDVKWSENDKINVNGTEFNLVNGKNTTSGSFTGTVGAVSGGYFASYPVTATNNGTNITFTIPDEQNTYNNGGDYDLMGVLPMAAYTTDENADLAFKNMVNVLKLNLTGSQSLTKIEVVSQTENLSGSFTVGTTLIPNYITSGTNKITVTKNMTLTSTAQTVYVVLPVFSNAESTVTVKFTGVDGVMTVGPFVLKDDSSSSESFATTPNHRYTVGVEAELVKPKPRPDWVSTDAGCSGNIYAMGGKVTLATGAAQQVEYGFVYSQKDKEYTPVIGKPNCTKLVGGTESFPEGTTNFTVDITDLTVGVEYRVRAYAIGENGQVVYDYDGTTTIVAGDGPKALNWNGGGTNGASPKVFTVADGKTVRFSQGNLQYIGSAATPYWKFADHQVDVLGTTTGQDSDSQTVDRDLFGWGTSGYHQSSDEYNVNYMPYSTSTSIVKEDYNRFGYGPSIDVTPEGPEGLTQTPGKISGSYYDWGVYNTIYAGSTPTTGWRTLTRSEWYYLINSRTNASKKWGRGTVGNCTKGMIILPDDWELPSGLSFSPPDPNVMFFNNYSYSDWSKMEAAGAVFLPVAGIRYGTTWNDGNGSFGFYWSTDGNNGFGDADCLKYDHYYNTPTVLEVGGLVNNYGYAVRLVR